MRSQLVSDNLPTLSLMPCRVSGSNSNSKVVQNRAARMMRRASSPNRFLGSPTARITLASMSRSPPNGSDIRPSSGS